MRPSVGRIVHYGIATDSNSVYEYAAIITGVHTYPETHVDLTVFLPGVSSPAKSYEWVPFSDPLTAGHWTWPPRV